jgi:hypothetical protein
MQVHQPILLLQKQHYLAIPFAKHLVENKATVLLPSRHLLSQI